MKNKIILTAIIAIFSILFINNLTYSYITDDPKCKNENCKCSDCKCGDKCTGSCENCQGCKDGKCEMKGNSSGEIKSEKCEMSNSNAGEIKERCCTKSSGHSEKKNSGEAQGTSDSTKICPVSGDKIGEGEGVTFAYLGKTYTLGCENCLNKFKAEPLNYIKGELLCPVMGEPVDKNISTVYKGTKYYFCCNPCIKKFNKNPDKYLNGYQGD
jgi:YHS domain-containing protein